MACIDFISDAKVIFKFKKETVGRFSNKTLQDNGYKYIRMKEEDHL
jgi:hypothetical protein